MNKSKRTYPSIVFAIVALGTCLCNVIANEAKKGCIVYKVIDERGVPVENAILSVSGWIPDQSVSSNVALSTDSNGLAKVEVLTALDIGGEIGKEGFYPSKFYYMFHGNNHIVDDRWEPWGNTNSIVLKRKIKPVPMYAKNVDVMIPVEDEPFGFDLQIGDLVMPYGTGVNTDLIFRVSGQYMNGFDRELNMTVSFDGSHNGIEIFTVPVHKEQALGSFLVSDHQAPTLEYSSKYEYLYRMKRDPSKRKNTVPRWGQNAYIRTRSRVDKDGKIKESNYGKIYGDLICYFRNTAEIYIKFAYYWNPAVNDRNVEFDLNNNLFKWTYRDSNQMVFRP